MTGSDGISDLDGRMKTNFTLPRGEPSTTLAQHGRKVRARKVQGTLGEVRGRSWSSAERAPRVSVIIRAYNAERWIGDALRSVRRQTFADYEVIVIDDGSTDGTAAAVSRAGVPVRYLTQPHRGGASALNRGIAHSLGEFIAVLDADDMWFDEFLATMVPLFEDPTIALITADNYRWNERRPVEESPRKWQQKPRAVDRNGLWSRLLQTNVITPSTTIVRRAVLEAVGPYDEALTHAEDYDMWLRITRAGYRTHFIDRPLGVVRLHSANLSRDWGPKTDSLLRIWAKLLDLPDLPPKNRRQILQNRRTTQRRIGQAAVGYVLSGQMGKARLYFLKACYYRPTDPRNLLGLLLTGVAPGVASRAAQRGWLGRPRGGKR